jgi:outer membrane protein assembly factor BamB
VPVSSYDSVRKELIMAEQAAVQTAESGRQAAPGGAGQIETGRDPLSRRLWPFSVIVLLQWVVVIVPAQLMPGTMVHFFSTMWGPIGASALALCWWIFGTRLSWFDAGLGLGTFVLGGAAALLLGDPTFTILGVLFLALPAVTTAWGLWILAAPFLRFPVWRAGLIVVLLGAWGFFDLIRLDGMTGAFSAEMSPRWSPTAEEQFLAQKQSIPAAAPVAAEHEAEAPAPTLVLQPGDWPEFRGPHRDARLTGVRIRTDWNERPPQLLWKQRIGPGWSSFAVVGTRLYTQEQRGEQEAVVCYEADTGRELWAHHDENRFFEVVAGPGPRATPTFHEGKIYALGAKGVLNCLDALTGSVCWTRNIMTDADAKLPEWGFASSPLVAEGLVTVYAGGAGGKSVLAYDALTGERAWSAGDAGHNYSSLQRSQLLGVDQLLLVSNIGVSSFEPKTGTILWEHRWPLDQNMSRVTQPAIVGSTDFLIGTGFDNGTRRVRLGLNGSTWTQQELWTTRAIRPYYNDLVVHGDCLYGFDNNFFVCVGLDEGKLKWKTRGYGNGQVLLLADQGLLLILSEQGEAALVEAAPQSHKQLARFPAIEGKTWNHPVVAHGKLFVRNGEQAACYDVAE